MKKFAASSYFLLIVLSALIIALSSVGISLFTVISMGFYVILYLFFLFLFGKLRTALLVASSITIIIQLLNQLKVHFYKERLFFPDIFIAADPNNFGVLTHYPLALLAVVGLAFFLIFNLFIFRRDRIISGRMRFLSLFIATAVTFMITSISHQTSVINQWESHLPKGRGTISNLFLSAQKSSYTAPEFGHSAGYFHQHVAQPNPNTKTKPDIVVFLQESAIDPHFFDIPSTALPALPQFNNAKNVAANNLLRVETYGGGTWLSEFSLLTGLNSGDFSFRKNAVFYTIVPHVKNSLFHELKKNGYYTVVLTPMNDMNYNAGQAYQNLGVDLILQPQDLGYPAPETQNLWHIPTQDLINYAKKVLETYTDKPLLIYMLSMYEHGPYDEKHPDTHQLAEHITDPAVRGRFNDYLSRVIPLNAATLDLERYLEKRNKPTLFLYFGDHQPAIDWKDKYHTQLPNADYLTQYSLRHYHMPVKIDAINEVTDIAFLGGLVLESMNADISPFYRANIKMRHLCEGKLADCEDHQLVESYKHYIYQDLKTAGD